MYRGEVCEKAVCAKEGEFINYNSGTNKNLPDVCCEELRGLFPYEIKNGKCERLISVNGLFLTCIPCGNGICESINNFDENRCNCPEDCEKEKSCADNDELVYASHINPTKPSTCCDNKAGIKLLRQLLPNGSCQIDVPLNGAIGRCVLKDKESYIWGACGNGICNGEENRCNCPEDCEGN